MSAEFRQRKPSEYLKILQRRKWLIVLPVIAITTAVGWVVYRLPDVYESTTLIVVRPSNLPTSVVITGIDSMKILEQAFEAVRTFQPLTRQQIARLLAKTSKPASKGEYELFKTTSHFDSTAQNPEWLGGEPARVKALAGY